MKILVKEQSSVYALNDDGIFECQHENYSFEQQEVLFYQGEKDCSYNITVCVCEDCGEEID